MTVNILGTPYSIEFKKYSDDGYFEKKSVDGYCDGYNHKIVICKMETYPGWEDESKETIEIVQREILRHEIVHAFLNESGLKDNSCNVTCGWAGNEEMVDWIANQGPKIYNAWIEACAINFVKRNVPELDEDGNWRF